MSRKTRWHKLRVYHFNHNKSKSCNLNKFYHDKVRNLNGSHSLTRFDEKYESSRSKGDFYHDDYTNNLFSSFNQSYNEWYDSKICQIPLSKKKKNYHIKSKKLHIQLNKSAMKKNSKKLKILDHTDTSKTLSAVQSKDLELSEAGNTVKKSLHSLNHSKKKASKENILLNSDSLQNGDFNYSEKLKVEEKILSTPDNCQETANYNVNNKTFSLGEEILPKFSKNTDHAVRYIIESEHESVLSNLLHKVPDVSILNSTSFSDKNKLYSTVINKEIPNNSLVKNDLSDISNLQIKQEIECITSDDNIISIDVNNDYALQHSKKESTAIENASSITRKSNESINSKSGISFENNKKKASSVVPQNICLQDKDDNLKFISVQNENSESDESRKLKLFTLDEVKCILLSMGEETLKKIIDNSNRGHETLNFQLLMEQQQQALSKKTKYKEVTNNFEPEVSNASNMTSKHSKQNTLPVSFCSTNKAISKSDSSTANNLISSDGININIFHENEFNENTEQESCQISSVKINEMNNSDILKSSSSEAGSSQFMILTKSNESTNVNNTLLKEKIISNSEIIKSKEKFPLNETLQLSSTEHINNQSIRGKKRTIDPKYNSPITSDVEKKKKRLLKASVEYPIKQSNSNIPLKAKGSRTKKKTSITEEDVPDLNVLNSNLHFKNELNVTKLMESMHQLANVESEILVKNQFFNSLLDLQRMNSEQNSLFMQQEYFMKQLTKIILFLSDLETKIKNLNLLRDKKIMELLQFCQQNDLKINKGKTHSKKKKNVSNVVNELPCSCSNQCCSFSSESLDELGKLQSVCKNVYLNCYNDNCEFSSTNNNTVGSRIQDIQCTLNESKKLETVNANNSVSESISSITLSLIEKLYAEFPISELQILDSNLLALSISTFLFFWDLKAKKIFQVPVKHTGKISCLANAYFKKKKYLLSGSLDGYLRIIYINNNELISVTNVSNAITCIETNNSRIYFGTKEGTLYKCDFKLTKLKQLVSCASKDTVECMILALKAAQEGPRQVLIIAIKNFPFSVRDANTGLLLRTISEQSVQFPLALTNSELYIADGRYLLSYMFNTGELNWKHDMKSSIRNIAVDGSWICISTQNNCLYILNSCTQQKYVFHQESNWSYPINMHFSEGKVSKCLEHRIMSLKLFLARESGQLEMWNLHS